MELKNHFRVAVPPERVWAALTDLAYVAPCMPGAELQEVVDDEYRGVVRVKVGPITAQYQGAARFLDKDDTTWRAVLHAAGRETRGQGRAEATVTAQLTADGDDGTAVEVTTDLTITGRVAQFGRGVLADVSTKLLDQFVACLEQKLTDGGEQRDGDQQDEHGAAVGPGSDHERLAPPPPAATPVDLLETAGAPIAKRLLPIAAVVGILLVLRRLRRSKAG